MNNKELKDLKSPFAHVAAFIAVLLGQENADGLKNLTLKDAAVTLLLLIVAGLMVVIIFYRA